MRTVVKIPIILFLVLSLSSVSANDWIGWSEWRGWKSTPKNGSTLNTNIVSFWKLGEESGTRVDDLSANDLTDTNTVTQATGIVGNAAQFTAANSEYLITTSPSGLNMLDTDRSMSLWFYMDSEINGVFLVEGGQSSLGSCFQVLWISATDSIRVQLTQSDNPGFSNYNKDFSSISPVTESWHHVVWTYDTTTEELKIVVDNGTPVSGTSTVDPCLDFTFNRFGIGARVSVPGNYFDGRIDAVGVWDKVLTAGEITELYNAGSGAEYPF